MAAGRSPADLQYGITAAVDMPTKEPFASRAQPQDLPSTLGGTQHSGSTVPPFTDASRFPGAAFARHAYRGLTRQSRLRVRRNTEERTAYDQNSRNPKRSASGVVLLEVLAATATCCCRHSAVLVQWTVQQCPAAPLTSRVGKDDGSGRRFSIVQSSSNKWLKLCIR